MLLKGAVSITTAHIGEVRLTFCGRTSATDFVDLFLFLLISSLIRVRALEIVLSGF